MATKNTPVALIKRFFEAEPHGRKVTMQELKDLDTNDRQELGGMIADELGVELEVKS